VRGVVVFSVPYLGLVSMLIPYPFNYALVGLILLFVFLAELRPSGEGEERDEGKQQVGALMRVDGCSRRVLGVPVLFCGQ
jgi:hypothetical protein